MITNINEFKINDFKTMNENSEQKYKIGDKVTVFNWVPVFNPYKEIIDVGICKEISTFGQQKDYLITHNDYFSSLDEEDLPDDNDVAILVDDEWYIVFDVLGIELFAGNYKVYLNKK